MAAGPAPAGAGPSCARLGPAPAEGPGELTGGRLLGFSAVPSSCCFAGTESPLALQLPSPDQGLSAPRVSLLLSHEGWAGLA